MSGTDGVKSFETLDVQVKALEGDVRDIKTSISNFSAEVRAALSAVTSQVANTQRTPWVSIGSIGSVLIAILGFMVYQTVTPMRDDIKSLKDEIVPRVEHNFRQDAVNHQFDEINRRFEKTESRKYDEMVKTIDQLELELKHK
jgi:hypothetical protein